MGRYAGAAARFGSVSRSRGIGYSNNHSAEDQRSGPLDPSGPAVLQRCERWRRGNLRERMAAPEQERLDFPGEQVGAGLRTWSCEQLVWFRPPFEGSGFDPVGTIAYLSKR